MYVSDDFHAIEKLHVRSSIFIFVLDSTLVDVANDVDNKPADVDGGESGRRLVALTAQGLLIERLIRIN